MMLWKKIISFLSLITVLLAFTKTKLHAIEHGEHTFFSESGVQEYTNVYRYKKNEGNRIALTFDDGPHPVYTEKILDILKKYNVKATFFMIGENVINYTETALRVKEEGHEIGNHTVKHLTARKSSPAELMQDMLECSRIIREKLGYEASIMRPPEGALVDAVMTTCSELDLSVILWNVDTRDWAHSPPRKIYDTVINNTDSGDIILMHDYIGKSSPTPEALELIIPKLIESGYVFVTVSELIRADE